MAGKVGALLILGRKLHVLGRDEVGLFCMCQLPSKKDDKGTHGAYHLGSTCGLIISSDPTQRCSTHHQVVGAYWRSVVNPPADRGAG